MNGDVGHQDALGPDGADHSDGEQKALNLVSNLSDFYLTFMLVVANLVITK